MLPADQLIVSVWAAIDRRDPVALQDLIHPEAALEMAMARGRSIHGRDEVLATLAGAWQSVYSLSVGEVHPLTDDAVIVEGRSRYPVEAGGFADVGLVWLCEFRDGLLWHQRLFTSLADAEAAWTAVAAGRE